MTEKNIKEMINRLMDDYEQSGIMVLYHKDYDKLIFVGFSQGAMMSLYNSIRLKQKCAGVISFSGKLIPPTDLSEEINSRMESS